MKESLKNFFAMLAGVDPSDIEMYAGEEDEFIDDIDDEFEGEPEFVRGATNVYRTRNYIVRQMLILCAFFRLFFRLVAGKFHKAGKRLFVEQHFAVLLNAHAVVYLIGEDV